MMASIGNRIFTDFERPSPERIKLLEGLPSSNINDEMNRLYCMHDYIYLLNPECARPLLGPALTVKVPLGDNLYFHQALDMAQPGDVIVVDGGSGNNRSLAGEIMMRFAHKKGLAGIVVDGCMRDWDGIEKLDMPIYAKGITPQGPWKNGPGEVNVPIACGGQVVFPGDVLVGDRDGIVVIRSCDIEAVAAAAHKKKSGEDAVFALMDNDFDAYCKKHLDSTDKRFKGAGGLPETFKSYKELYR